MQQLFFSLTATSLADWIDLLLWILPIALVVVLVIIWIVLAVRHWSK